MRGVTFHPSPKADILAWAGVGAGTGAKVGVRVSCPFSGGICFCLMSKQGQLWNVGSFLPLLGSRWLLFETREGLGQG